MLKHNQITATLGINPREKIFCVKTQLTYYTKTALVLAGTSSYPELTLTFTGNVFKGPPMKGPSNETYHNKKSLFSKF